MTSNLVLLSSCLMLTASPVAMAQSADNQHTSRASTSSSTQADQQAFVQTAAIGNMTEIQLGKLAEQKSSNGRIKSFAQDLMDDHQAAQTKLKRQAGDDSLPNRLDSEHQQMVEMAQNAKGADFDRQ